MGGKQIWSMSSASLYILSCSSYSVLFLQLGSDISQSQSCTSAGDPGSSWPDTGPSDLDAREEQHPGDDDFRGPSLELPSGATESRQLGQSVSIEPDPLEQESTDDNPGTTIQLPNLQITQRFVDALRVACLENSRMQPEDINSLRDPGLVLDLEDPSPLLRSMRHFINNFGSSHAHYEGI